MNSDAYTPHRFKGTFTKKKIGEAFVTGKRPTIPKSKICHVFPAKEGALLYPIGGSLNKYSQLWVLNEDLLDQGNVLTENMRYSVLKVAVSDVQYPLAGYMYKVWTRF